MRRAKQNLLLATQAVDLCCRFRKWVVLVVETEPVLEEDAAESSGAALRAE